MPGRKSADSPKPATNPKYRSIDDILEALKDKSANNSAVESQLDQESDQVEDKDSDLASVAAEPVEGVDEEDLVSPDTKSSEPSNSASSDVPNSAEATLGKKAMEDKEAMEGKEVSQDEPEADSDEASVDDKDLEARISNNPEPVYRNVNPNSSSVHATVAEPSEEPNFSEPKSDKEGSADMPSVAQNYPDYPINSPAKRSGGDDEHTLDDIASEQPASFEGGRETEPPIRRSQINQPYNNYSQAPNATYSDPSVHNRMGNPASRPFDYSIDRNGGPTSKNKLGLIFLVIFGLVVVGGAAYLLKYQFNDTKPAPSASPTEVPSTSPAATPEPTPTADRSKFKIRVLNGTSQSGLAATVQDKLKGLGYQGDRVGNATNSAFTRTQIRVKPDNDELLKQLTTDLAPTYDATSSTALKATDTADAEVILGSK